MTGPGRVCLAFDLDGPAGDQLLSGRLWDNPSHFCLGAYGPDRAVPRLIELLAELGIRATFFTPGWVAERWPKLIAELAAAGHELAGHGHRHEDLSVLDPARQRDVLARGRAAVADAAGAEVSGFRAPSGEITTRTLELLVELGYSYSSSLRDRDRAYRHECGLVEVPTKTLFDDYAYFAYHTGPDYPAGLDRVASYSDTFEAWADEMRLGCRAGAVSATIWHPKVIATPGRLHHLETMLRQLSADPDVRFGTCSDVAEEVPDGSGEQ